jgi:hypothetical protein
VSSDIGSIDSSNACGASDESVEDAYHPEAEG